MNNGPQPDSEGVGGGALPFTGERYVPAETGEIRLEHLHRYAVALELVAGKDVLDIASGEGYGSFLLSSAARSVVGIDVSEEAVGHARRTYNASSNLQFLQGNAADISAPDQSFDVVVSFETIEHLAEQAEMISEIHRVLKRDGVLIISSPNRPIYSGTAAKKNAFHVKELDFHELDVLLRTQFSAICYYGQRLQIGSIVQPLHRMTHAFTALTDDGVNLHKLAGNLVAPVYYVAVCASDKKLLPILNASIFQPEKLDLLNQYIGYAKWAINSNNELEALRRLHAGLQVEHGNVAVWARSLDEQVSSLKTSLEERDRQIAKLSFGVGIESSDALEIQDKVGTLEAMCRALGDREAAFALEVNRLENLTNDLSVDNARLKAESLEVIERCESLASQLASAVEALSDRDSRLTALVPDLANLRTLLDAANSQLNVLRAEQSRWITEKAADAAQIECLQHEIEDVRAQNATLGDTLESGKADSGLLQTRLLEANEQILARDNRLAEFRQEIARSEFLVVEQQEKLIHLGELEEQVTASARDAEKWASAYQSLHDELEIARASFWRRLCNLMPMRRQSEIVYNLTSRATNGNATVTREVIGTRTILNDAAGGSAVVYRKDERMNSVANQPFNESYLKIQSLNDLLEFHDEEFLYAAYHVLLRRSPDVEGMTYYRNRLRQGVSKLQIVEQICYSKEARGKAVKLEGLQEGLRGRRWLRMPVLGVILRHWQSNSKLQYLENQLSRLLYFSRHRFDDMEKELSTLRNLVLQQSQMVVVASAIQQLNYPGIDIWGTIERLLRFNGIKFVEELFQTALRRAPKDYELNHYKTLLDSGVGKIHIVEVVFSCEECQVNLGARIPPRLQVGDETASHGTKLELPKLPVGIAAHTIYFNVPDKPKVSVIVPVYGKVQYTLMCLKSIQTHAPKISFEIIVVDDCSPDNTLEELAKVRGLKLVANPRNFGFIRSCNRGAEVASGEFFCFLNNDTEVTDGWLDALMQTILDFPGTGLVGSKLIYPDGTLQEAGGIIWRDGSAWNFGRGQNPLLPVFNYAREVDYCSGASILLPCDTFQDLGGFDEHYVPAYCEDSDLALKVRDRGLRVIYQPLSVVVHYEGITSGTDTTQGVKAYQIENSKKLFNRWRERLVQHQVNGEDVDRAKDRSASRRVLVLDHCTPTPDQDAGSVTVLNLLYLLREMKFQVTFIPEDNFLYMPEYTTKLQRMGVEVLYAPYCTSVESHLSAAGDRYDLAFLFRPGVVNRHLKAVRENCPSAKILYHTVDLHYLRMMREADVLASDSKLAAAREMKVQELRAIRNSDAAIVHSTTELDLLRKDLRDANLHVFPLIVNACGSSKNHSDRHGIVFIGGYQHTPNVDAVQYFVRDIMPHIRSELPGVCFYAVGSKPPQEIRDLACEDVIITGFIKELNPFLDRMRVSVAPLRYGAGIKGKIGSAMAVGLPTVATTLAVEGMSLTNGVNTIVADGASSLAKALVRLYKDPILWDGVSKAGIDFVDKNWGAEAAWEVLEGILRSIGITVSRGKHPLRLYVEVEDNLWFSGHENTELKEKPNALTPVSIARNKAAFLRALDCRDLELVREFQDRQLRTSDFGRFTVDGFCVPCNKTVPFIVDMESGGFRSGDSWTPNWRERVECPLCHMNNRQRLIATLVKQRLERNDGSPARVYFMEQVTPIIEWVNQEYSKHDVIGSEYLGHNYRSGDIVSGIRHEDIMDLSFDDGSIDLIVSNDVFEHVPNPAKAFRECARVLREGGSMVATIPFDCHCEKSIVRSILENGRVKHILEPNYHGNPVSPDGSLVFTDFGWDMLKVIRESGFGDVYAAIYASIELGHFGNGQIVFEMNK